jgi:Xaa-Pro aminopeptidase
MSRIDKIKEMLDQMNLDAFYITHIPNIRYITEFSGSSAFVLITRDKDYFLTDFRYKEQSAEQVKGFDIRVNYKTMDEMKMIFSSEDFKRVGFESTHMSIRGLENLNKDLPGVEYVPVAESIEKLTMIKTPAEIETIKKAIDITDKTFLKMLELIKPGMKEKDVSAEISYWHKKYGADKDSFDPIVASGWRGALPHGIASDKVIESGEMVTLDFGCIYNGFCSDLTRTISVGSPSDEMKKIYNTVYESQMKAISFAKEGVSSKELDSCARDYISEQGYGEKFGHGLGHGLGIEVHEMPSVSQRMDMKLEAGVVVTIEPGIYVENLGGVRIEDDILIQQNGCEVLNKAPKELIII